MHLNKLTPLGT